MSAPLSRTQLFPYTPYQKTLLEAAGNSKKTLSLLEEGLTALKKSGAITKPLKDEKYKGLVERYRILIQCITDSLRISNPSQQMAQQVYHLLRIEHYFKGPYAIRKDKNILKELDVAFPHITTINKVELAALRSLSMSRSHVITVRIPTEEEKYEIAPNSLDEGLALLKTSITSMSLNQDPLYENSNPLSRSQLFPYTPYQKTLLDAAENSQTAFVRLEGKLAALKSSGAVTKLMKNTKHIELVERYQRLNEYIAFALRISNPSSEIAQRVYHLLGLEHYMQGPDIFGPDKDALEEIDAAFPHICTVHKAELAALRSLSASRSAVIPVTIPPEENLDVLEPLRTSITSMSLSSLFSQPTFRSLND